MLCGEGSDFLKNNLGHDDSPFLKENHTQVYRQHRPKTTRREQDCETKDRKVLGDPDRPQERAHLLREPRAQRGVGQWSGQIPSLNTSLFPPPF